MAKGTLLRQERTIGYHTYRLMTEKSMTVSELAKELDMPEIKLQSIRKGSGVVEEEDIVALAEYFDVEEDKLLEEISSDEMDYNVHCMGKASSEKAMNNILDKVDLYVRLLNEQSEK